MANYFIEVDMAIFRWYSHVPIVGHPKKPRLSAFRTTQGAFPAPSAVVRMAWNGWMLRCQRSVDTVGTYLPSGYVKIAIENGHL